MTDTNEKYFQLRNKLDLLQRRYEELLLKSHEDFSIEIKELRDEINSIIEAKVSGQAEILDEIAKNVSEEISVLADENSKLIIETDVLKEEEITKNEVSKPEEPISQIEKSSPIEKPKFTPPIDHSMKPFQKLERKVEVKKPVSGFNVEKYVGEHLGGIIGVIITLIGLGVGVKYSIDKNLISPETRIGFAYLMSLGLLGFGIWFKKKYENYSAILVSGSIGSLYFITFFAYNHFHMMGQFTAFFLMVLFTIFAVIAAINYNRVLIAHIGLVGAYAVPFLLSNNSGQAEILFSYMAIVNTGILVLSVKKYWKSLYYSSFSLTWIIFLAWYFNDFNINNHFEMALIFISIFFTLFYIVILSYKLHKKEIFNVDDVILMLANAFIFYGLGYAIINSHPLGDSFLGLYTLLNAFIHFVVSVIIYRQKLADKNIFYLVSGLVLTFLTIAVPVQLDGRYVTLVWAAEAALLFWIGRTKAVSFYEKISYALMFISFISLIHDWQTVYSAYSVSVTGSRIMPLWNINFLTSLLFIGAFLYIHILFYSKKYTTTSVSIESLKPVMSICMGIILAVATYFAFYLEINTYWNQLYIDSFQVIKTENVNYSMNIRNSDLLNFKWVWIINYSILFVSIFGFLNIKKFKNDKLGGLSIFLNGLALFVFITFGEYCFSELRDSYLQQKNAKYYPVGSEYFLIRYISYAFVLLTYFAVYRQIIQEYFKSVAAELKIFFDFFVTVSMLFLLSFELIACMDMLRTEQPYKLGMSILWSIYALVVISYGLWKRKKHLRVGAMVIFGITIFKVFFYDLAALDTISKTIVLVSLGVLLLISSFLYNKFKNLVGEEDGKVK